MSNGTCAFESCDRAPVARGWCDKHYRQARKHGQPGVDGRRKVQSICPVDGCSATSKSDDVALCSRHERERRKAEIAAAPPKVCSADGCTKIATRFGTWCEADYRRDLDRRPMPPCTHDGCTEPSYRKERCRRHYAAEKRANRVQKPCAAPNCSRPLVANGLCRLHWNRVRSNGEMDRPVEPPADTEPRSRYSEDPPLPAKALFSCLQCGVSFTRDRSVVRRALAEGRTEPYCSRGCSNKSRELAQAPRPTERVAPAQLITTDVIRTETKRRRYYDEDTKPTGWCASCGKKLATRKARTCFACYQAARAATYLTIPCDHCGTEYRLMRAEHEKRLRKGQTARYCSAECFAVAIAGTPCEACGTMMPKAKGRRFCSDACRAPARLATRIASGQTVLESKTCQTCGEVFRPSNSRRSYCSRPCAEDAHSARMVGEGNSHYKDGTSYAEWFRRMRPLIIDRDGCCRVCAEIKPDRYVVRRDRKLPQRRSQMAVHHIDQDPTNNRPENLIYLCQSCHMVHHKSTPSPYPWFGAYAVQATLDMSPEWRTEAAALAVKYGRVVLGDKADKAGVTP